MLICLTVSFLTIEIEAAAGDGDHDAVAVAANKAEASEGVTCMTVTIVGSIRR